MDTSGTVVERYVYDPYGAVTVLEANWAADADGISDVGWAYLHQGGRYDAAAGLYHFNNGGNGRDYSPTLGRWLEMDRHPDGPYVDGMNAYQYLRGQPTGFTDPTGEAALPQYPRRMNPYEKRLWDELGALDKLCMGTAYKIALAAGPGLPGAFEWAT